jgi:hypothetical protein
MNDGSGKFSKPGVTRTEPEDNRRAWHMRGRLQDYLLVQSSKLTTEELDRRVPGHLLVAELDGWLSSFLTRKSCQELYELVTGMGSADLLIHHRSLDLHQLKPRLAEAFRDGELVAIALGPPRIKQSTAGGKGAPASAAAEVPLLPDSKSAAVVAPEVGKGKPQQGGEEEEAKEPAWVAFELVEEDGTPVANARYRVVLPDGEVREGTLDADGHALIEGIPEGACKIFFPDLDDGDAPPDDGAGDEEGEEESEE